MNYQDPENFGVALLDHSSGTTYVVRYVEFVDGKAQAIRASGSSFTISGGTQVTLKAVVSGSAGSRTLEVFVAGTSRLSSTGLVDDVFTGGGHVGLYRATSGTATTLVWDDFKCGVDQNSDGDVDDSGTDYIWADYNFDSASWKTLTLSHDANGNLTGDGLYKYTYDVWNRLVGVWYDGGDTAVSGQRVARYEYDGLFRHVEKELSNQGDGIVYGSNPSGITGIQAGDRFERYYYAGWRVLELRDNYSSPNRTLGQFVYGTQYIDEPVAYDRNTDVTTDSDCLDSGGSTRYFYHQDANYRVTAVTDEDGAAAERYEYNAYGEPTILRGGPVGNSPPSFQADAVVS